MEENTLKRVTREDRKHLFLQGKILGSKSYKDKDTMAEDSIAHLLHNQARRLFYMPDHKEEKNIRKNKLVEQENKELREQEKVFKMQLRGARNIDDMVVLYEKAAKLELRVLDPMVSLDAKFKLLRAEAVTRGVPFDDAIFPENSSSMVNNRMKTKKDYADLEWKSLSKIYEVTLFFK